MAVDRNRTHGQASDTDAIQTTTGNIEAPRGEVFIDIGPGKPCSNVNRPRVFMNDNFPGSGHGYVYALGRRKARVAGMSSTLDGKGYASLVGLLKL